jgi:SAM-dependent methyltransferase
VADAELTSRRRSAGSYHQAMSLCPAARAFELDYPLQLAGPEPGCVLVDFPSAGGYLAGYLEARAPGSSYLAVEHTPEYEAAGLDVSAGTWSSLPFPDQSVDIVVCLAALHHVFPGREVFYQECKRLLRPGGCLVIGDVFDGSNAARFLGEFVHRFSPEGHVARFFLETLDVPEIQSAGLEVTAWEEKEYSWDFPDEATAVAFCRGLFRLQEASDDTILKGLQDYLGLSSLDGRTALGWQLAFVRAESPAG